MSNGDAHGLNLSEKSSVMGESFGDQSSFNFQLNNSRIIGENSESPEK